MPLTLPEILAAYLVGLAGTNLPKVIKIREIQRQRICQNLLKPNDSTAEHKRDGRSA